MEKNQIESIYEHLEHLHDSELYSSTIMLAEIIVKIIERVTYIVTPTEYYQVLCIYANAHLQETNYKSAESIFREALRIRGRSKFLENISPKLLFAVPELRYKLAQCLVKQNQHTEAITILESIPIIDRTPKVNFLIAKLAHDSDRRILAVAAYKDLVRKCPLALDGVIGLLALQVKGVEVNSLVVDAAGASDTKWLAAWIEAHAYYYQRDYELAIAALTQLLQGPYFKNIPSLLEMIAKCHHMNGDYDRALVSVKNAYVTSNQQLSGDGMVLYASHLSRLNLTAELEQLISVSVNSTPDHKTQHWFVLAHLLYASARYEKAVYLMKKVMASTGQSPWSWMHFEAALFKANILIKMQKYPEAIAELQPVSKQGATRFEWHKSLVECYMKLQRLRDARLYALSATNALKDNHRTQMLVAKTHEHDVHERDKVKMALKRALKLNRNYLPAVYMMASIMSFEDPLAAIKLLKKHLAVQPNVKLMISLADIYVSTNETASALEYYNMALKLDPTNSRILNALNNLTTDTSGRNSMDQSNIESTSADREAISNNNIDTDDVWSDWEEYEAINN